MKDQDEFAANEFIDVFAIDLKLNEQVTLECKFQNTMQNLEGQQASSFRDKEAFVVVYDMTSVI